MDTSREPFDITVDFKSETPPGKDPDAVSPTLRRYHQLLWSKPLRSGKLFQLEAPKSRSKGYLVYPSLAEAELYFGSDAITNSYSHWGAPKGLVQAKDALTQDQRARYLKPPYTIGSAMIWPMRSAHRPTLNQARGTRAKISDRMDLTLECIRRHYGSADSPLADVLANYSDFFSLFDGFCEFVDFFFFRDLVYDNYTQVRFTLDFDDFASPGVPVTLDQYVQHREATLDFISRRETRMRAWASRAQG